uniref:dynein heavy chain 6, axonemal-like n=1 Tax=Styela clava TaxID=7725 RepID=UPI0019394F49|nr:dynein heavy chain 6, axonemal-like [Styela clava]
MSSREFIAESGESEPTGTLPTPATATNAAISRASQTQMKSVETGSISQLASRRNKQGSFLAPDAEGKKKGIDMMSRLYDRAEDSLVIKSVSKSKITMDDASNELTVKPKPPEKGVPRHRTTFRTTFFKKDHERKILRNKNKTIHKYFEKQNVVDIGAGDHHGKHSLSESGKAESDVISLPIDNDGDTKSQSEGSEIEVVWEPVTTASQMGRKSGTLDGQNTHKGPHDLSHILSKLRDNMYDNIEPADDDVINHIIRLRLALNWKTMLPRHGPGVRRAMKLTNHKNPLKEPVFLLQDAGEYVYAIERSKFLAGAGRRTNPFDLQVVSAETARKRDCYYLITATSVTKNKKSSVEGVLETEITPVIWWIYEQRLFNMICDLPVFVKFRLWKQFVLWRNIIRNQKTSGSGSMLQCQLFLAEETLQKCLVSVRSICEDACGSRDGFGIGENAILLIQYNNRHTYSLDEFCDLQNEKCSEASTQLEELRKSIADMCYRACSIVAERDGITKDVRLGKVERRKYTTRLTVEEDTGPTFAQLASWRQILSRLKQFIRHVDNILLETLHRLIQTAVRSFLAFVSSSVNYKQDDGKENISSDINMLQEVAALYSKVTNYGQIKGHQSMLHLRRIVTGVEARKVEEPTAKIVHETHDEEQSEDSSMNKYSPRQTESIVTSESEETDTKTIEQIEREKELDTLPHSVFLIKLELSIGGSTSFSRPSSASSRSSKRRAITRRASFIANQELAKKDEAEAIRDRRGKRVSFPNLEAYSDDDFDDADVRSGTRDDVSEYDSQSQASSSSRRMSKQLDGKPRVVLSPTKDEFERSIQDLLDTFESVVAGFQAMSREPSLYEFTRAPAFDLRLNIDDEEDAMEEETRRPWPDLDLLLGGDEEYVNNVEIMMNHLDNTVDLVDEYSKKYGKYCEMVEHSRAVDVNASLEEYEWGPDEFSAILSRHTDMLYDMKLMEPRRRIGMLHVDIKPFFHACLPFPQGVVDTVHERLPGIAVHRNEELLRVIRAACRKLDSEPASVEQFVEHLTFLARLETEMTTLEKEFAVVNRLFAIMRQYSVELDPEDTALYQTLVPTFQHLKSTVLFCQARKDENILRFSTDLDQHIHDLRYQLFEIKNKVASPQLLNADLLSVVALETLKLLMEEVANLTLKAKSYANYQDRFGSSYSHKGKNMYSVEALLADTSMSSVSAQQVQAELSEVERDLTLRKLLWESQDEWARLLDEWKSTPFRKLNVDSLQKNVNRFTQSVFMLEKGLPHNEILPKVKQSVFDFKLGVPVITALHNPCLKQRHWDQIQYAVGRSIIRNADFTLGNFLELRIFQHRDLISEISTQASNESTLENMLSKLIDLWHHTDFKLVSHQSGAHTVMIITAADDVITLLEESQVTISTIKGSRYVTPIKTQVEDWDRRLGLFSHTLDEWMQCQRNWLYLEAIFTTADIQRQLQSESQLFNQVDRSWKELMRRVEDHPNALRAATAPGVFETLQSSNSHLEKIHKSLEDYLEMKRLSFPRFYFLSNDELLDVLAQGRTPSAIQPHLGKCFANIRRLDIRQSAKSGEGLNVRARGPVEQWLQNVETAMYDTVKKHLKSGLLTWSAELSALNEWVLQHPGQVVLTVAQIMFNKSVVSALNSDDCQKNMTDIYYGFLDSLEVLSGLVSEQQIPPHQYQMMEALIIIYVHSRDIIKQMIHDEVSRVDDFEWKRQLRYEWQEATSSCHLLQADAKFHYGYEYLGCAPRLVITPLTDRCFLTLTGALSLHLGGSPAGPAGTGKSESVKDLAKVLGKQCVVFNCSEGLDYKMMGQFFSGLAQSGSWCCFDEFNRIDVEVLSVIASQVHTIKSAKDAEALRFMFEGREIRLNHSCGFFITMNPGYRGRVELPDNLKSLFRPVAMMVPDYALIAEIILYSEGFHEAKVLSRKIVNLYHLASKQLSQQDHYDFGMRAIKSVLIMAGQKKRIVAFNRNLSRIEDDESISSEIRADEEEARKKKISEQESYILIHALRDANLPKFLAEDVPLFESIMFDLFPGVEPPSMDNKLLEQAIDNVVGELGTEKWPNQIQKVIQLHSQLLVRHGVMLVGPSGGGKTTVRNILQKALGILPTLAPGYHVSDEKNTRRKRNIESYCLNPKCMQLGELYGQTDPNTLEWSDGLLAHFVRKIAKEMSGNKESEERPPTSVSFHEHAASPSDASRASSATHSSVITEPPKPPSRLEDLNDPTQYPEWRWIILDGPVDTMWVENLNTVLDDTKTLCLANGERIPMSDGIRLLFEVDDLSQASPATISRCAMVYLDPVDLGWRPYVTSWLSHLPKGFPQYGKKHLLSMFELSVDAGLQLVKRRRKLQHLPVPSTSLISSLCKLLQDFIFFMETNGGFGEPDEEEQKDDDSANVSRSRSSSKNIHKVKISQDIIEKKKGDKWFMEKHPDKLNVLIGKLYVFAFTWSIGGTLNREDDQEDDTLISSTVIGRDEMLINMSYDFDHFVHETFEGEPPLGVNFPSGSRSIFSYFVDMQTGHFTPWEDLVPETKSLIARGLTYSMVNETMGLYSDHKKSPATDTLSTLVPTTDTIRYSFLSALLLLNKQPVLLTGDSGVGKTALLQNLLNRLNKPNGMGTQPGTVLGEIFHNADKASTILQNIANLGLIEVKPSVSSDTQLEIPGLTGSQQSKAKSGNLVVSTIQFSAQTVPSRPQAQILHKLVKRGRETVGPPRGKRAIAFINDLNMPTPEKYGAQPPLELLRQFLELGGFYDLKRLSWKNVIDVTIAASAAPPGGGRNVISARLLKHFTVLAIPQPSTRSMQHIYQVQLGRFMESRDFMPEVKECRSQLVSAAIAVYYKMCNGMLPTPDKSHYTFNLRDLSAIIKGVLQANETVVVSRETIAHLFAHEATRVFHDRLIDQQDRKTFFNFLSDDLHNYFKITITAEKLESEPLIFGDFLDMNVPVASRIYRHLPDRRMLNTLLMEYYMRISAGNIKAAPLVFFNEAVGHIIRASRIFRQPGGHALLVGIDGTGKVTTCKLSSQIAGCELYRLSVVRGYSYNDFREELKKVFRMTGVHNSPTVFLLTDSDIVNETILEDINCILNTGEDPDLFDGEELDTILMDIKQAAVEADIPDTQTAVYRFFLDRVRNNLHVALTLSPVGSSFRQRCRTHPALVNCCTIDWFDRWPSEALISVAQAYFTRESMELERWESETPDHDSPIEQKISKSSSRVSSAAVLTPTLLDRIASVCVKVHASATKAGKRFWDEMRRYYYTTPSSYLEFIQVFTKMLSENRKEFDNSLHRLNVGLTRLSEAKSMVGSMQQELVELGPKIEQKAMDTEKLMAQLKKDTEAVNQVREIVKNEEQIMARETQIVQEYAEQATRDLQSVLPALQEAVTALDALDKSDIAEIRVYQKPPELVATVMNAVCILLQEKPDWQTAKKLLADQGFLRRLIMLDRDGLPDRTFARLRKVTKNPDFTPEKVGMVSSACMSICTWVMALQHYNDVQRMVEPKQRRVKEAREALQIAEANLKDKQASLTKIKSHLDKLRKRFEENVQEQERLKERKIVTAQRLRRASVLINALADEEVRWHNSVEDLEERLKGLVGDTIVSAAAIGYLGAFTSSYRRHLISKWLDACTKSKIVISKDFNLIDAMAHKNKIRQWHSEGLPRDFHSIENAIIIKKAHRWPLIIDPQGQAIQWIKKMEGERLRVVYAGDTNYTKIIENAIRVGEPVLLHDVDENIDPGLKPVLQCELIHRAGQDYIMLGDSEISYNHNFRLYMTTGKPNPHFLPAVCIMVTIINFTVTFEGLQDQLLSSVVMQERPHLETLRDNLLESIAKDLGMLRELEDKALNLLQKQQGHILDDEDLMSTLKQSKITSGEVSQRLKQAEENERRISHARSRYLPVATRGAVLQFVLADLEILNPMYQFSLSWFIKMFEQCIAHAHDTTNSSQPSSRRSSRPLSGTLRPQQVRDSPDLLKNQNIVEENDDQLPETLQVMIDILTEGVYRVVSYSLFNIHQLSFSFLICAAIMRNNAIHKDVWRNLGQLDDVTWQAFLHTPALASMISDDVMEKYDGLTSMQRLEMKAGISSPSVATSHPPSSNHSGSRRSSKDEAVVAEEVADQEDEEVANMLKAALTNVARGVPPVDWISSAIWQQCKYLAWKIEEFQTLCLSIVNRPDQWNAFQKSSDVLMLMSVPFVPAASGRSSVSGSTSTSRPQSAKVEQYIFPWERITTFQRLMLVKVLRPDMLMSSMRQFVIESVGSKFVMGGKIDLTEIYKETNSRSPIIFILSPGTDPSGQLLRFAKEMRGSTLHVDMVSLGRGQGPKAEELIHKAQILKGRWVFLQNCHLAASFMPRLQAIVDDLSRPNSEVDSQFRLWLSSKPDASFPVPILQKGLKITVEPPQGLRANLMASFSAAGTGEVTKDLFDTGGTRLVRPGVSVTEEKLEWKNRSWKKLVFALCFFNAVAHERKKYDALGFNLPYEFTSSDLEVSLLMLQQLMIDSDDIPWPALRYLTGEVVYGGRVTDHWDRRCLDSTLRKFYCENLKDSNYTYSEDGVYKPVDGDITFAEVQEYLEQLPLVDSPDVFGMHDNAERAHLESEAKRIIEVIIDVQPRLATAKLIGSGRTNDEIVMDLANDIQKQLPITVEIDDAVLDDLDILGGKQDDEMKMTLEKIMSGHIWKSLITKTNQEMKEGESYHPLVHSALLTVLRQEIDRFDRLLRVIHFNIRSLMRAIKGEIVMSEALEKTHASLLMHKVPTQWQEAAYESCKMLGSWVADLTHRIDFFATWSELVIHAIETKVGIALASGGPTPSSQRSKSQTPAEHRPSISNSSTEDEILYQPKSFWLSAFFFPQGFLTGVLQNYARKYLISVDSLAFQFHVFDVGQDDDIIDAKKKLQVLDLAFGISQTNAVEDGVKVFGLYLDGARWDPEIKLLVDSLPGIRHFRMPEIHFLPVPSVQNDEVSGKPTSHDDRPTTGGSKSSTSEKKEDLLDQSFGHMYECPLYRTSTRAGTLSSTGHSTNFVSAVSLPSHLEPDHWILRGAALLCQLDE